MTPLRGTDSIIWTVKFRDGQTKRFRLAIRTTPWGSIQPYRDFPAPTMEALKTQGLYGEAKFLGVDELPSLSKN